MGTSAVVIPRTYRAHKWSTGQIRPWPQPPGLWLPSTHYTLAKVPFSLNEPGDQGNEAICKIYPRPDTEVKPWARHKSFFWDGIHSLPQAIPLGLRGGSYPINWYIIAAPATANATIGTTYTSNGVTYGDLIVTPTGSFTNATFWVRGYDQTGDFIDFIWTASTYGAYNATNGTGFLFAGANPIGTSASDSNNGSIGSPFASLQKLYGTTQGASTFPQALVMLSGSFMGANGLFQQGSTGAVEIQATANPSVLLNYPGQPVVIDITNGNPAYGFGFGGIADEDTFLQGITFTGVPSGAKAANTTYRYIWQGAPTYRCTLHNISFPNVFSGYNQSNNSTGIYWSGSFTSGYSQYLFLKRVSETNRGAGNATNGLNYGIFCAYATSRGLAEFCSITGSIAVQNLYLKSSDIDWTLRCNTLVMEEAPGQTGWALATGNQPNSNGPCGRFEVCYNFIVNSAPPSVNDFGCMANAMAFNYADFGEWWYRNTVINGAMAVFGGSGNGAFEFESNVVQWNTSSAAIYYYVSGVGFSDALPLPSGISNTGTACQAATGVVDTETYLLIGAYRTNYLGQYGAEIG